MMKTIRYILVTLAALLSLAACAQITAPGSGGTTGRVVLSVSPGAPGAARTILPAGTPEFSKFDLDFNSGSKTFTNVTPAQLAEGLELSVGTWTVEVKAYRKFTPTSGANSGIETDYLAAQGASESFTLIGGQLSEVPVALEPFTLTDVTEQGIFTYNVTFPAGVTAYLYFEGDPPVPLTSGQTVSVEKTPGQYDLRIILQKGPLSAGTAEKVHIYSGLESKAEFTFEDADFVQSAPLAEDTWTPVTFTAPRQTAWYTFPVTANVLYNVEWTDGVGAYTGEVDVWAYTSSAGYLGGGSSSPHSMTPYSTGTVYVSVSADSPGDYRIKYYDASSMAPQAVPVVSLELPIAGYAIRWNAVGGATAYQVSRSDSETGTYTPVGSVPHTGDHNHSFTDTVSTGTYWYKVRAVNGNGPGPDSAPVKAPPPALPNDTTWAAGNLTAFAKVDWYSFPAEAGKTYRLQWDDAFDGTGPYTGDVYVAAYRSDGSPISDGSNGYSTPIFLSGEGDTVYVRVYPNMLGTYAVRYEDVSSLPPQPAPVILLGISTPDYTIVWEPVAGATEYQVSRSDSQPGPYSDIGSQVTHDGSPFYTFTDTVSSGTYWYRVRAVNANGPGPESAPVMVDASAQTALTEDIWEGGDLTTAGQVDWYTVTAGLAGMYSVRWDSSSDGTGSYTGTLYVSAYGTAGPVFENMIAGYNYPQSFPLNAGETVYVKVAPAWDEALGTYAIKYYPQP
jgi:hypothetical protein